MKNTWRTPALVGAAFVLAGCQTPNVASPESTYGQSFGLTTAAADQVIKLTAGDGAAGDLFGVEVSVSGDRAIVGAPFDDDAGSLSGSAYIFRRHGMQWIEEAKLTAGDAAADDIFGGAVSLSGNRAIVGAPFDDDAGTFSGSAYIFRRAGGSWSQEAKLTASDAAAEDAFGGSVSIDGDWAVVGAGGDDDAGPTSGSVYIFRRHGTQWTEVAKLTAGDAAAGDAFGSAFISGDVVIVGAAGDGDAGANSGSAYIFRRIGGTWSQEAKLTAADAAAGDAFGSSVSISRDLAIVGARLDGDAGLFSGSAYVFQRAGGNWSQEAKLTAGDAAADDFFGSAVSISGNLAVVGTDLDDGDAGANQGAAYIFRRAGGSWSQQAQLIPSDAEAGDGFGRSVSISGNLIVVGSFLDDDAGINAGSAYVYCARVDGNARRLPRCPGPRHAVGPARGGR